MFVTKNRKLDNWRKNEVAGLKLYLQQMNSIKKSCPEEIWGEKNPAVARHRIWFHPSTVHQCPIRSGLSGGVALGHSSVEHIHLWKHSFQAIWWQNLLSCHCISQHPLMRNSEGKISPIQGTLGTRLHMHKLESFNIHWLWQHLPGRTLDNFTQNLLLVYKSKLFLYHYKETFCEICKKSSAAHTKKS